MANKGNGKRVIYLQAKESFVTQFNGEQVAVKTGELVHPDHPIVKGRESLFRPSLGHIRFDMPEQMTAAPGEKRGKQ